ncbi:hypothetical protein BGK67_04705 [Streptomyces subrutilus]|uniref:Uncharacterized protein n=1 Tax=Streptomyces subrutilus TaxID=36818 RepID=A0A1E5PMI2_9ACTN|nr:hypothetical protein BGK67_04705 [Streptomyces subrutilus]
MFPAMQRISGRLRMSAGRPGWNQPGRETYLWPAQLTSPEGKLSLRTTQWDCGTVPWRGLVWSRPRLPSTE